jgi:NCAIR mutase (PurE)-related protein
MLNSCAVGVSVVNIDNGFGAGALAARILRAHAHGATSTSGGPDDGARP